MGLVLGAMNGMLIVVTRVPDIVVTLATLFVLQGAALLVLDAPGGAVAEWLKALIVGTISIPGVPDGITAWIPKALIVRARLPRHHLDTAASDRGSACRSMRSAASELAAFRSGVAGRAHQDHRLRAVRACSPRWAGWR